MLKMTESMQERSGLYDAQEPEALFEMISAIAAAYVEDIHSVDIRHLWSAGDVAYFRVNWWRDGCEPRVRRSAFVAVEYTGDGYRVVDMTTRRAA